MVMMWKEADMVHFQVLYWHLCRHFTSLHPEDRDDWFLQKSGNHLKNHIPQTQKTISENLMGLADTK
jgi:hypothetical protein